MFAIYLISVSFRLRISLHLINFMDIILIILLLTFKLESSCWESVVRLALFPSNVTYMETVDWIHVGSPNFGILLCIIIIIV